jgi:PAS domain S-box-containing protein
MKRNDDLVSLYWRYWPIFAGVLISFYVLWVLFTPETFGSGFFPATLVFTLRVAATYASVRYYPKISDEGQRRAWRYFSVGLWIWMVSDALEIIVWGLRGEPWPEPSLVDLLHLAGYLAVLTGCASYPLIQPGRFGRLREVLEVSILAISVLAISWLIYLSPSIISRSVSINSLLWLSISPVLDLILTVLGLRLMLLQRLRNERLAFGLFSLAFLILFLSDMNSSYAQVVARASIPSLTQAGWMGTATLLGLAFQWMAESLRPEVASSMQDRGTRWIWRLEPLVPVALTYSVVGYVFFDWWFSEVLDWVGIVLAAILIILLFARQGVISGQREMSQFAALVNSTSDMAFILDEGGKIKLANPALRSALGDHEEPLDTIKLEQFIQLPEDVNFGAILEKASEHGWKGEVSIGQPDGVDFPVQLSLNPVAQDLRNVKLIAGTAYDLTPIRQREDELRRALNEVDQARSALAQLNIELEDKVTERTLELEETVRDLERLNQELTELDQLKSEFVALVSHELRAPMTNIRSGIELLLERYPNLETAPKKSLGLVQAEVQRLSRFVETILDLSALEAGKFPIEVAPIALDEVIQLALERFPENNQARVKLSYPETMGTIQADQDGLESVFYHLLDNAFKYAPKGEIDIVVRQVNGDLELRVMDRGPGITPDQRARIFEMFHRLDSRDSREVYGYGLGLPMVQRLLAAMGGTIEAAEGRERGTEMIVRIPQR